MLPGRQQPQPLLCQKEGAGAGDSGQGKPPAASAPAPLSRAAPGLIPSGPRGMELGCGSQLGTELSPECPPWVQSPRLQHGHHPVALPRDSSPGPLQTLPRAPIAPAGMKKQRAHISLPIAPIYSPERWQDSRDLITLGSSSAPSRFCPLPLHLPARPPPTSSACSCPCPSAATAETESVWHRAGGTPRRFTSAAGARPWPEQRHPREAAGWGGIAQHGASPPHARGVPIRGDQLAAHPGCVGCAEGTGRRRGCKDALGHGTERRCRCAADWHRRAMPPRSAFAGAVSQPRAPLNAPVAPQPTTLEGPTCHGACPSAGHRCGCQHIRKSQRTAEPMSAGGKVSAGARGCKKRKDDKKGTFSQQGGETPQKPPSPKPRELPEPHREPLLSLPSDCSTRPGSPRVLGVTRLGHPFRAWHRPVLSLNTEGTPPQPDTVLPKMAFEGKPPLPLAAPRRGAGSALSHAAAHEAPCAPLTLGKADAKITPCQLPEESWHRTASTGKATAMANTSHGDDSPPRPDSL